jgi:hypothetical protein
MEDESDRSSQVSQGLPIGRCMSSATCPRSSDSGRCAFVRSVLGEVEFHARELCAHAGPIAADLGTDHRGRAAVLQPARDGRVVDEGRQAVKVMRQSGRRFRSSEVRLCPSLNACGPAKRWSQLVLPQRIGNWSLGTFEQRLLKAGGRVVKRARYYWLLLAEGDLRRRMFGAIPRSVVALPVLRRAAWLWRKADLRTSIRWRGTETRRRTERFVRFLGVVAIHPRIPRLPCAPASGVRTTSRSAATRTAGSSVPTPTARCTSTCGAGTKRRKRGNVLSVAAHR